MIYSIEAVHTNPDIDGPSQITVKVTGDGLSREQVLQLQIEHVGLDIALRAIEFAKVELLAMQREQQATSYQ